MIKKIPTKYDTNTNYWIVNRKFEDYHTELDRKKCVKYQTFLLLIDQCAAYSKNTTFLGNIKDVFLPINCIIQVLHVDLGIIHSFKCHYRKQGIPKTVTVTGNSKMLHIHSWRYCLLCTSKQKTGG
jgi:hypothetical protein